MADSTSDFHFIVSDGPKVPDSARTLIRKQAMKDVGLARKKKGNYVRVNLRQVPVYDKSAAAGDTVPIRSSVNLSGVDCSRCSTASSQTQNSSSAEMRQPSTDSADEWELALRQKAAATDGYASCDMVLASISPCPDYQRARSRFGVELTDLAMLTNFNVGKSTIAILSADPARLASLLGQEQWSYLAYVPARYGTSECLTTATDCLLAKAHSALTVPDEACRAVCNRLYGKALRALQDALADDSTVRGSDVLCATQLLSLHEVCSHRLLTLLRTRVRPLIASSFLIPPETLPGHIISTGPLG